MIVYEGDCYISVKVIKNFMYTQKNFDKDYT